MWCQGLVASVDFDGDFVTIVDWTDLLISDPLDVLRAVTLTIVTVLLGSERNLDPDHFTSVRTDHSSVVGVVITNIAVHISSEDILQLWSLAIVVRRPVVGGSALVFVTTVQHI